MTPDQIVDRHVHCNVTGLVSELIDCDSDLGREMMYGSPEDEQRAYDAMEVWLVSHWLAARLRERGHRVVECWYQSYWARGASGGAVLRDPVIQQIAQSLASQGGR